GCRRRSRARARPRGWRACSCGRTGCGSSCPTARRPTCSSSTASASPAALRRLMVEHGESFWQERWTPLYSFLGGNPLAAMPSLHFATSVMAALVLADTGPVEGAVGWAYAIMLGFALVH